MSLRTKLVRTMIAMLLATGSATILVVAVMSVVTSRATLRTIEAHLRQGILDKGGGLVGTQALALRDLVNDNAFGDVARLIERTVEEDPQVSYGLFLDAALKPWAYSTRDAKGVSSTDVERWRSLEIDAATLRAPGVTTRTRVLAPGERAFEFAVPVVDDQGAFLGSVRYALSDQPLREAVSEARAASRRALATTVILLLLLGGCTTALGVLLSRRAGARIARPIVDLTRAARELAAGRRDIRVGIAGGDELEILGSAFNDMTAQLKSSYDRLEDMNRNLEGTVADRTRELASRNTDMRLVLDNVKQGFVTVSRAGELAQERSSIVDDWFGPFTAGTPFARYVAAVDPAFAAAFGPAYEQLLDDVLPRDLCLDQLPRRMRQGARELRCNYVPLTDGEQIHGLLVVIEDVTAELVRQHGEADRKEMFALFEALTKDRAGLLSFFEEGNEIVGGLAEADLPTQKRLIHTLKGNSAMAGFEVVASVCHGLESEMSESSGGPLPAATLEPLRQRWTELTSALDRFLGARGRDTIELSAREIAELARDVQAGASSFQVRQRLAAWQLEPAERPLGRLGSFARALAKRLGKGDLEIEIDAQGVRLDPEAWSGLWSQLVHVVRNAVDHGVETLAERQRAQKPDAARLRLGASIEGGLLCVVIEDDGAGIDWDAVAESARREGLPYASQTDRMDALFALGVTTRAGVTKISGRGVGLAAVRKYVEEHRGTLLVESRKGKGTSFRFRFPLGELPYDVAPERDDQLSV